MLDILDSASEVVAEHSSQFIDFYRETQADTYRVNFPRLINTCIDSFDYYSTEKFNSQQHSFTDKDLKVININVRGISANYDNLTMWLNSIAIKFDMIILTECHIQSSLLDSKMFEKMYPITGYNKFYVFSIIKYGGVIIYVKDHFECIPITKCNISNNCCDSLFLQVYKNSKNPVIIGGIYRHCRKKSDEIITFIRYLDETLTTIKTSKNKIVLCGDFNIDLIKSVSNTDSLYFLNTILMHELENHIFKPTRIQFYKDSLQVRSATLIDLIASNLFESECTAGNLQYSDSDHYATFTCFKNFYEHNPAKKVERYRRIFDDIDTSKLFSDFNDMDWESLVYSQTCIDTAVSNLNVNIASLLENHAPLVKISNRKLKYCSKPWIDKELQAEIHTKNKLFHVKKSIPTEINKVNFSRYNNYVTAQRRKKKKIYLQNYFNKHRHDSGKMWIGINYALESTNNNKQFPVSVKNLKGELLTDPQSIADNFADYFESVPTTTRAKIKPSPKNDNKFLDHLHKNRPVDNYLVLHEASSYEIEKLIKGLSDYSSSGPSILPNKFLKLIAGPLSYVLAHIVNTSMQIGYVPLEFKIGKQTPVYKSGEVALSNFRPITVCSSLSKILEKVVRTRLMQHIEQSKILTPSQFGFRKCHSTNHAMINLLETTLTALDNGLKTGGVYLDVSKAFDVVSHRILLRKLEYYGVRANALMWFESYLTNRTQYVSVKNKKSKSYTTSWGVPQGGTLAPILFILFMNDIVNSSKLFEFSIYADDTCLGIGIVNTKYNDTIKVEFNMVMNWFQNNHLLANAQKTDYLFFGPHHNKCYEKGEYDMAELHCIAPLYLFEVEDECDPDHHTLNAKGEFVLHDLHKICPKYMVVECIENDEGNMIMESETVKYLGVYFDSKLTFKKHTAIVTCKINRLINMFWKMPDINLNIKKVIYHSLVESHINYGILIWASALSKNVLNEIETGHVPHSLSSIKKAQNKVIRSIFRLPKYDKKKRVFTDTNELYKKLEILKFHDLYFYNIGILCFEFFTNAEFPSKINTFFDIKCATNTRTSDQRKLTYKPPKYTRTYRKPSLCGSAFWNKLPKEITNAKSLTTFKKLLKQFFINKY